MVRALRPRLFAPHRLCCVPVLLCLLFLLPISYAGAAEPKNIERESYERELIQSALDQLGLTREFAPKGKTVERIEILRFPVVRSVDPYQEVSHRSAVPHFVEYGNFIHVTTQRHIVAQELLFAEGQTYDESKVRESARNLRGLPLLFSTVRIVAARGSTPDRTVVVIITKDLWSLRMNANGNFGGGVFNYFYITPSEQNFLGLNQQLSLHARVDRETLTLGQVYRVPRVWGSRIQFSEMGGVRTNHLSGDVEGGYAQVTVDRPLYSLSTRWGFFLKAEADLGIDRFYQGADYRQIQVTDSSTGNVYLLPEIFEHRTWALRGFGRFALGEQYRTVFLAGYILRSKRYALTDGMALLPEGVRQAFVEHRLPVDDEYGALVASVQFFEADYRRFHNVQTLGLTEDFRIGPMAYFEAAWSNPVFGFAQSSLQLYGQVGWRFCFGDDILSLSAMGAGRYMPEHGLQDVDASWVDRVAEFSLENVSPSLWGWGRVFLRLRYARVEDSLSRSVYVLGGDNTLRGFVSNYRSGDQLLNMNLEFRSRPWVFDSIHLGFVAFYDAGDAFGAIEDEAFRYHHSLGFGFRGLFPVFDRGVTRLDVGIPLGADFSPHVIDWVTISFLQAF